MNRMLTSSMTGELGKSSPPSHQSFESRPTSSIQ